MVDLRTILISWFEAKVSSKDSEKVIVLINKLKEK